MQIQLKKPSVLPGFGLTMGFTLAYLSLIILIPMGALVLRSSSMGWSKFVVAITKPEIMAAYRLSFGASLAGALMNAVFGFLLAWVLVRYSFPGKRLIDAMIDLPFALPTAVSGIALSELYCDHGWIGRWLPKGYEVSYTSVGVVIVLTFIGLPFVVRTLQPALEDLDPQIEEAAASLGAGRFQTFFRVILPAVLPALLTGFSLAFARALGEYGSVVFIAGSSVGNAQIVPMHIITNLHNDNVPAALALGVTMLVVSFVLLFAVNLLQWWSRRYTAWKEPTMSAAVTTLATVASAHSHGDARVTEPVWLQRILIAVALTFVGLFLALPLALVMTAAFENGVYTYFAAITSSDSFHAIYLTLLAAAVSVPASTLFGLAAAWAIAKFQFVGKNLLITLIDLPFSVSPVIAGVLFVVLFSPTHGYFADVLNRWNIQIIFAVPGIIIVTMFVTFPFVARELIPLLEAQGTEEEQAARVLGASGWQIFWSITLPNAKWGLLYGVILCNARAMGEFGAVSVVTLNVQGVTNTIPLEVKANYDAQTHDSLAAAFAVASLLALLGLVTLVAKTLIERQIAASEMAQSSDITS